MDVHGFVPAYLDADARDLLTVRRAGAMTGGTGSFGAVIDYGNQPLVARRDGETRALIEHLGALNLVGGFAPHQRIRFDATVPVYTYTGETIDGIARNGTGIGDARISAMVSLVAPDADGGLGVALVPHLDIPSGQFDTYLGRRRFAGGGVVSATYELGAFTMSGEAGIQIETRATDRNIDNRDAVRFGAGAGALLTPELGFNVEVSGRFAIGEQVGLTESPIEAMGHIKYAGQHGGSFLLGGGAGLTQGAGAAVFRVFVGGAFSTRVKPGDKDDDGIVDNLDDCPLQAEVVNDFQDGDGCPDALPELRVVITADGEPVSNAAVRAEGPRALAFQSELRPYEIETRPGETWSFEANYGACLAGTGQITIAEQDAEVTIPLERKTVGQLKIVVYDPNGEVLPGVEVRVLPAVKGCAPSTSFATPADGPLFIDVGQGTHVVQFEASGSTTSRQVAIAPGAVETLMVVLQP